MKSFIITMVIIFALVVLPVPLPEHVTGPIKLFGILVTAGVTAILIIRKSPHERLQEQQAEARKRYKAPDPYLLGVDAARHNADFTLSRREILSQCEIASYRIPEKDRKEFMRGATSYVKTSFADPVHIEI
jgi:hypothetical protein